MDFEERDLATLFSILLVLSSNLIIKSEMRFSIRFSRSLMATYSELFRVEVSSFLGTDCSLVATLFSPVFSSLLALFEDIWLLLGGCVLSDFELVAVVVAADAGAAAAAVLPPPSPAADLNLPHPPIFLAGAGLDTCGVEFVVVTSVTATSGIGSFLAIRAVLAIVATFSSPFSMIGVKSNERQLVMGQARAEPEL